MSPRFRHGRRPRFFCFQETDKRLERSRHYRAGRPRGMGLPPASPITIVARPRKDPLETGVKIPIPRGVAPACLGPCPRRTFGLVRERWRASGRATRGGPAWGWPPGGRHRPFASQDSGRRNDGHRTRDLKGQGGTISAVTKPAHGPRNRPVSTRGPARRYSGILRHKMGVHAASPPRNRAWHGFSVSAAGCPSEAGRACGGLFFILGASDARLGTRIIMARDARRFMTPSRPWGRRRPRPREGAPRATHWRRASPGSWVRL